MILSHCIFKLTYDILTLVLESQGNNMDYPRHELKYGLCDNKLTYIDEVERGLNCRCICPNCGGKLIAKKGSHREHHFAHYDSADCKKGSETALHIMAKEIIYESKCLYVPYIPHSEYDFHNRGSVVMFNEAELEKQLCSDLRSDVLLKIGDKFLNVEIKVNHAVDEYKLIKLFNNGIPTIEIDLSEYMDSFTEKKISDVILKGNKTTLLYSPKAKGVYAKRILGEWKKILGKNKPYVENCHYTKERAYFSNGGSSHECHECWGGKHFASSDMFLCRAMYGALDFNEIDKIVKVHREEGIVKYAKLLMNDLTIKEFGRAGR